ncbi:LapA family protein [Sphingomonas sinipercae]|uniref:LapA family protein n=1 Tax=Sphingomonas sinipercae TaxID=2714944 RepID=A0A6G7ZN34_9SPHN|nr:LapA family protein [Sphingomonas sinipercae]QIL02306.1 LapA family protein [Sphingomonas sinipercae]
MKFLKALMWVAVTTLIILFAIRNWQDVTLSLWGDLRLDIKVPLLLLIMFLAGFLPAWATYKARLWNAKHRPAAVPPPVPPITRPEEVFE